MSKLKRILSGRTALVLGAWVAYLLAFIPLYRRVGATVTALTGLPVIVMGWLFGMSAGLLAGLLGFLLDVLLLTLIGEAGWDMMIQRALPGTGLLVLVGAVVGRLHDLGEQVGRELTERKRAEEALQRRTHDLGERVKELDCLYGISALVERPGISLEEILRETVALIPLSWQYPETTCARIILDGQEFRTENFREAIWKQASDIVVYGERIGTVEIYYLEEKPESDEGPFLKEEINLLSVIAERVGSIIERKRAEEALRTSEERFRQFFENGPEYCYMVSLEGVILDANSAALEALGYKKEELVGKPLKTIYAPESLPRMKQLLAKWGKTGDLKNEEVVIITREGNRRTVLISAGTVRDKDGDVLHSVSVQSDITERKRMEEALRESEERYRNLVEHQGEGIGIVDAEERFTFANPAGHEIFGVPPGSLLGRDLREFVDEDGSAVIRVQTEMRRAGQESVYEMDIIRPDEQRRRLLVTGRPQFDQDGQFRSTFGIFRDITERKQIERERERLLVIEREQRLLAETLSEVTLALTSLTSHQAVLDEILRQVQRIVPYRTANIALWEGDVLRVVRWRGYKAFGGEELVSSLVQTLDDLTVDLDAIQSRQPLAIPDTGQEPRWVVFPETAWVRSYLVIPICLHGQVLGLLRLDSDTPGEFSAEDGERLQPLANVAAIALENAQLFGEVQRLAITDGLTGTHNRRHFFELAERELNRARRFGQPVSAIMLDVDHFKQVNDTYGHAVGDQVLRVVAERCGGSIRDIDILGRYGGEEFAIILPGTDLSGTPTMAERLRRSIADAPVPTNKGDLTVTISLGVASSAQDDADVAALLNRADAAMYEAKQAGRNRVAVRGLDSKKKEGSDTSA